MSFGVIATVAVGVVGGVMASNSAEDAANTAANAQKDSATASIEESRRQFEAIKKLLEPYTNAGTEALQGQKDLLGLNGGIPQQNAIQGIANGQQMQALTQQGENALRQNAAATGGLRGGNLQGALAEFRPQLLNELLQKQYTNLGGLTSIGQNAAAGVGNAGQTSSGQIIDALQQQGAATAGAALASGQAQAGLYNNLGGLAMSYGTGKLLGKF